MRKVVAIIFGGLSLVPSFAHAETLTGQVIDLVCYTRNKANTGLDHDRSRACAIACSKWEGQPVGLLTADGKVYQFTGQLVAQSNARIVPHLSHTVTVTGDLGQIDGMLTISAADVTMAK